MTHGERSWAARDWEDVASRRSRQRARHLQRGPKRIADILAELITKKGYARSQGNEQLAAAWRTACGDNFAGCSRAIGLRGGQLEVVVANSTVMQELGFHRRQILREMQKQLPEARINQIRFRVGHLA